MVVKPTRGRAVVLTLALTLAASLFTLALLLVSTGTAFAISQPEGDGEVVTSNVYLRTEIGEPWGLEDNDAAMDRVFGEGNWEEEFFETVNTGTGAGGLFSSNVRFIFLDGSDSGANALEAFLTANETALKNFVDQGGSLLLNSAPNEGDGLSYDGRHIIYDGGGYSTNVVAADPAHAIFNGPFTPAGTRYIGPSFGHAFVEGAGLTPLILRTVDDTADGAGDSNAVVLAEYSSGSGITVLGGMTMSGFHEPQPNAQNLRANIIHYAANFRNPCDDPGAIQAQPNKVTRGTAGDDVINGTEGSDTINGGGGDDTICGREGENTINGGTGNDQISSGGANDQISGADGDDRISSGGGDNQINGGIGNDQISSGDGNDQISGADGDDFFSGGDGNDRIKGDRGGDTLFGVGGDDTLDGGLGPDAIDGGDGTDKCSLGEVSRDNCELAFGPNVNP
jgi:Ca2+-binding RTX toxin-like protein